MNGVITNVTARETRRCDMLFGVSYTDDLEKVRSILHEIIQADPRVLADPAPQIVITELAASSVNFAVRPWVNKDDYWDLFFDMQLKIKSRFDAEGISIPYPQQDIHIIQPKSAASNQD
ncbi:MAG: mechanosensitive ion channel family protein [Luteolibacter sp.]